jgi:hypothetical protein
MARPKVFYGSTVGVKLSRDLDLVLRGKALETGRTLSDLIRESLIATWRKGQKIQEMQTEQ